MMSQKAGREALNAGAAMMLRAERQLGEMLAGMEKNEGGRPSENQLQAETSLLPKLSDLGIRCVGSLKSPQISAPIYHIETREELAKIARVVLLAKRLLELLATPNIACIKPRQHTRYHFLLTAVPRRLLLSGGGAILGWGNKKGQRVMI